MLEKQLVYFSQGWKAEAYHFERKCKWLRKGQAAVAAQGGDPAPVQTGTEQKARSLGLVACRACG